MIDTWNKYYALLLEFRNKNGHLVVFKSDRKNQKLKSWCVEQISLIKRGKLPEDKKEMFISTGIDLQLYNKHWSQWESNYKKLVKFRNEHGHSSVSQLKKGLGPWSSAQRVKYRQNELSSCKIKLLNEIDFDWSPSDSNKENWESQFDRLVEFKRLNGHCNVKREKGDNLGTWVSAQRTSYRKEIMPEKRILLLEGIGFEWSIK